ncbi:helix-turn-helix domain-containing protein [Prochlorococcus sp. MIT 1341]|uniref:helix-turn-helix domain-containing protein n=1 Tax=Prochlorococcus sp. MIT 1341 TaxID=3096221 RepID=UPI002A749B57|nr:helix-turn-helix domain-containing protein [Prochlorococcus sp. MIT 1341]
MRFKSFWRSKNKPVAAFYSPDNISLESLRELGLLIRSRRESQGKTIAQLAVSTRISITVLEAIERGWIDRLPEPAYLSSMLALLEAQLEIQGGTLDSLLKATYERNKEFKSGKPLPFTPGNIDILTTWQGAIVYLFLMISSVFLLNQQHKHIAEINSISLRPFASNKSVSIPDSYETPLDQYKPVVSATRGSKKAWLDLASRVPKKLYNSGLLVINLTKARSISLRSSGGSKLELKEVIGKISLRIVPPLLIEINPPLPSTESIYWNGKKYSSDIRTPGVYRLPNDSDSFKTDSFDLPQKEPRS